MERRAQAGGRGGRDVSQQPLGGGSSGKGPKGGSGGLRETQKYMFDSQSEEGTHEDSAGARDGPCLGAPPEMQRGAPQETRAGAPHDGWNTSTKKRSLTTRDAGRPARASARGIGFRGEHSHLPACPRAADHHGAAAMLCTRICSSAARRTSSPRLAPRRGGLQQPRVHSGRRSRIPGLAVACDGCAEIAAYEQWPRSVDGGAV